MDETTEKAPPARAAQVKAILDEIAADLAHWKPDFDRMKRNRKFARGLQWPGMTRKDLSDPERLYVENVTMRLLKQGTSATYARNPRYVWRRAERVYHKVWDGTASMLQTAIAALSPQVDPATGQMIRPAPNPLAQAIAKEASDYAEQSQILERGGRTLAIIYSYYIREQNPPTKKMMKRMVLAAGTDGVGYVKQTFQRKTGRSPDIERALLDARSQLDTIQRLAEALKDGDLDPDDAEMSRLTLLIKNLEEAQFVLLREGLAIGYPDAMNIIPSRHMSSIVDFVGCPHVTERYYMTAEEIEEVYGKKLTPGQFKAYTKVMEPDEIAAGYKPTNTGKDADRTCVYECYNRHDGLIYTVCDGYEDFLAEPAPPYPWTERFWPWFVYAPNALHDPENPMPPGAVEVVEPMQREINRAGEGLRMHRHAARPGHVTPGLMNEADRKKVSARAAHEVVGLTGMAQGDDVRAYLQAFPTSPIDPNLYDTGVAMQGILRSAGVQEANIGPTSKATATESSIAQSSRQAVDESAIDELDDMLTEMARTGGQILMQNLTAETAMKIAGPGAVWLPATREDLAEEVYLEVEAGSSGRKNQAHEIQVRTQMWPIISALGGISQERVAKDALNVMDSRLVWEDWLEPGAPSVVAANGMMQAAANASPEAQGPAGASNAPTPEAGGTPGPQPQKARPPEV